MDDKIKPKAPDRDIPDERLVTRRPLAKANDQELGPFPEPPLRSDRLEDSPLLAFLLGLLLVSGSAWITGLGMEMIAWLTIIPAFGRGFASKDGRLLVQMTVVVALYIIPALIIMARTRDLPTEVSKSRLYLLVKVNVGFHVAVLVLGTIMMP